MSLSSWRVEPARSRQTSGAARIDLPRFSPVTRPFRSGVWALGRSFPAGETRRHVGRGPPGPLRGPSSPSHAFMHARDAIPKQSSSRLWADRPIARHNWFYPTVSITVLLALSAGACTDIDEQGNWIYNEYVWSRRWLTVFVSDGMKSTRHKLNEISKTNNLLNKHNFVAGSLPKPYLLNFNVEIRNDWIQSNALIRWLESVGKLHLYCLLRP